MKCDRFRLPRGVAVGTLLLAATAQAAEPISTDRPDFVESSLTVGKGRFQIETSIAGERDRSDGVETRTRTTTLLTRSLQVDTAFSWGANKNAPDFAWTASRPGSDTRHHLSRSRNHAQTQKET